MTQATIAYTQMGVNKAEEFFSIQEDNNIAKKGAKVFGRGLTDAALTIAGLVETTAFAILTVITLPTKISKLFSTDRSVEAWNNAKLSAQATVNAFKGIAGYSSKTEAPVADEVSAEEAPAAEEAPVAKPANRSIKQFVSDNKRTIGFTVAAASVGIAATYLGFPQAIANIDYAGNANSLYMGARSAVGSGLRFVNLR